MRVEKEIGLEVSGSERKAKTLEHLWWQQRQPDSVKNMSDILYVPTVQAPSP